MSTLIVVPAYQAHRHLGGVLAEIDTHGRALGRQSTPTILVVDDGSTDDTLGMARAAGVECVRHPENRGKGAALHTGLEWAHSHGFTVMVSADADGQHPGSEILRLVDLAAPANALILGVRDLAGSGAPRANQFSNTISNRFLSLFTGQRLLDTQCGLRRYPVKETLALGCKDPGYAFEAEVILRAVRANLPIVQVPIQVRYPAGPERISHFRVARDPMRIVCRVVATLVE
ncbi:MAG TPA: glycosyltransferase family 2 protein [Polyangiaceae bacterium]|nr:glycosyltransferase family 2 protein [Polyangiaceae bacterium]